MHLNLLISEVNAPLYLVRAGYFTARHVENDFLFVSQPDLLVFLLVFAELLHSGASWDIQRTRLIPEWSTANLSGQTGFDALKEIVLRVSLGIQLL